MGLEEEAVTMAPTKSTGAWLGRWVDPDLPLPADLGIPQLEADEISRLTDQLTVILFASSIPRRLGGDAASGELALDKRRCRRAAWALRQALGQWTRRIELPDDPAEELRIAGATLDWDVFAEQHVGMLTERTKRAATWAALNAERKWGISVVTRFENERRWIIHSLR